MSWKSVQWELSHSMQVDGWTDMMKLIVAFCNFVNIPKNWIYETHGHLVYYLHNYKLGYNIQWHKFPNLQWHDMTCLWYDKHHNMIMMLLTGLSVNILCLPKWTPPPPKQYSLFRTIPVHSMFLCIIVRQTLSENDLVKNLLFISGNTLNLMCTHRKFQEHNTTSKV